MSGRLGRRLVGRVDVVPDPSDNVFCLTHGPGGLDTVVSGEVGSLKSQVPSDSGEKRDYGRDTPN